jgi:hypothetical protein
MRAPAWWPKSGLWRHPAFLRLWAAQIISAFGSRITRTALPIIAVLALDQGGAALGALAALQFGPGVALALVAGGLVDRGDKRRILVACDLVRAALVASLPIAWWAGALTMAHVCIVAAGVGAASALFGIADGALLPALIGPALLGEGNAKLEATEATAEITGPPAAGVLISALGAPVAVLIDAASYLWSAAFLWRLPAPPVAPAPAPVGALRDDLAVGLRAVFGHPLVRPLVIAEIAWHVVGGVFAALYSIYCLRELRLSEAAFGLVIGAGGLGAIVGAIAARHLPRGGGLGPTLIVGSAISVLSIAFVPAAAHVRPIAAIALLAAHQIVGDGALMVSQVNAVTLRQTVLPAALLGRASAAIHACCGGALLISAVVAGLVGAAGGAEAALVGAVLIGLAAPLALLPLRRLRGMPATPDEQASTLTA